MAKTQIAIRAKRGMSLVSGVAVSLIILVVVIIFAVTLFIKTAAVSVDPTIAQCQQSATLAGIVRVPGIDESVLDFNCAVSHNTITLSSLTKSVPDEKVKQYNYPNNVIYNLNKQMWQQVVECYQKVNYGEMAMFSRGDVWGQFKSIQPTYCVVCSVVAIDPAAQKEIADRDPNTGVMVLVRNPNTNFADLVSNENISGTSGSLSQILGARQDVVGAVNANFDYRTSQAIIYYRTQVKWFGKLASKIPSLKYVGGVVNTAFDDPQAFVLMSSVVGVPTGLATIAQNIESFPTRDVDGIFIVNYDPTQRDALNNACDIIGNEKYLEK